MADFSQVWEKFEEPKTTVVVEETSERKTNYKPIIVTEIGKELDFYAQLIESGKLWNRQRVKRFNTASWKFISILLFLYG